MVDKDPTEFITIRFVVSDDAFDWDGSPDTWIDLDGTPQIETIIGWGEVQRYPLEYEQHDLVTEATIVNAIKKRLAEEEWLETYVSIAVFQLPQPNSRNAHVVVYRTFDMMHVIDE